jgi:TonB family protein
LSLRIVAAALALSVFAGTSLLAQEQTPPEQSEGQPSSSQDPSAQGSGAPRSIRVGGNVAQANLIYQVTPVYPPIAKTAHISGTVVLHAIIGKDGTVQDLQYISGPPLLMKSAMDAVRQWKYKPTLFNGNPVTVDTTVTVIFTLGGSNASVQSVEVPNSAAPEPPATSQRPQDSKAWPEIVQSAPAIAHPAPIYPTDAKEKHIEGVVVLRATISESGSVKKLEIESGPPELTDAAKDAVRRWQFTPIEVNGTQVETQREIAVLFSLTKNNYKLIATSFEPIAAEAIASTEDAAPLKHPAAARSSQTAIPDTLDGIQKQTQEVLDAWRAGDKDKFQRLLDGFAVEDPQQWLTTTFGAERSDVLVPKYEISLERFKQHMTRIAGYWEKSKTSFLRVETSVTPNPPKDAGQADGPPVPQKPLSIENFRFYVRTGQEDPGDWVFSFVYVNGAFRIVGGTHTFWNGNWKDQQSDGRIIFTKFPNSTPTAPVDRSQEPFIYEQVRGKMRYENDGTGVREVTARMRVQTPAGLAKAGQLVFDYNAANEKIEIRNVKVTKPNGSVITAGASAVQDLSAPVTQEAPMYTDARRKHVTVPGLAVGDIVEYDVIITTFEPLLPGQFWQTWTFVSNAISLDEQVDLDVPRDRPLKIKAAAGIDSSNHDEGNRRIYHWATSTQTYFDQADVLKNFKFDVKTMLEGVKPPAARTVMFSTFQSWEEIGTWYSNLERERRAPTAEVRAQADEIVRGQTSDVEKVRTLYEWVSRNIRYVSLSFGVGRYQPHAAAEVLENRYGDCKDKTTLLEALLEAEGFHGLPVLINSKADIDPDVPTPLQFDHAITFISLNGTEYWLDPTIGVGPFGYLLPQLRGERALLASADGKYGLRRTPSDLPYSVVYQFNIEGSASDSKDVDIKLSLDTRSDLEVLLRIGFMHMSPGQLTTVMQNMQKGANTGAGTGNLTFSDLKGSDASDTRKPFHLEIRVQGKVPDSEKTAAAASTSSREQSMEELRGYLSYLLPTLGAKADNESKADPETAKSDRDREFSLNFVFTSPEIKKPSLDKPIHVDISKDFAEFKADIVRDGQSVRGKVLLNLRTRAVPTGKADEYAAFVTAVSDCFASLSSQSDNSVAAKSDSEANSETKTIAPVTTSKNSDMPSVVHRSEVIDLYKQGQDEAKQHNYANAVESFTSALKLAPQYPEAWRELGRAQMYLRNYSDAETAFRKYLALAPDDHLAYSHTAWVLYTEKKYTEEVDILEKRIAASPNDGDANARLGTAYLALHQPEKALPVLQKAVSILPQYEYPQFNLARAYLQLHQEDIAAAEFQRAIKLSDTSSVRNSAAYALAEANTHLEIAATWANDAINAVELELNQAKLPLQTATMLRVSQLAAYWDTMGWIKFQQGDLSTAEKYIRASTELADDSTILMHLGKICEAQKRAEQAIEAYAEALASVPTARGLDEDEKEARARLVALLGNESLVEDKVKQSRAKVRERRSVAIPNPAGLEGITQYVLIVGPGSKVVDLQAVSSDDSLMGLKDALRSAMMPQSFPDNMAQKLPRAGTLSCPRAEAPCTFTLTSAGAASQVIPAD